MDTLDKPCSEAPAAGTHHGLPSRTACGLKVLIASRADLAGGAARASYRLHRALRRSGVQSFMQVLRKTGDNPWVLAPESKPAQLWELVRPTVGQLVMRLGVSGEYGLHSVNVLRGRMARVIEASDADVVNLHWVNNEALSIAEIGRIRKPVVWTLHDMWTFCGAEHYTQDDDAARFRRGYRVADRPSGAGIDVDRWVWERKRRLWRRPFHVVCPSQWLAECARRSALLHDWPVHVVPNPLDLTLFKPLDKAFCRAVLNLPQDVPLVGFGAWGGGKDQRKGMDLLFACVAGLHGMPATARVQCVVFGQGDQRQGPQPGFPVHYLGHLGDDWSLAGLWRHRCDRHVVTPRESAADRDRGAGVRLPGGGLRCDRHA